MTTIVDRLHREHVNMASLLTVLDDCATDIAAGNDHDYALIRDLVKYFTKYPDRYHHRNEDILFEWMQRNGTSHGDLIAELKQDHQAQAEMGAQLLEHLNAVCAGHMVSRPEIVELVTNYVKSQRDHIDKEEGRLLKEARELIDAAGPNVSLDFTTGTSDPIFGGETDDEFVAVVAELRRRL